MSAMALSHVCNDGQAQTCAAGFTRTAAVYAVKTLCQARQVFSFNSRTAVLDEKFSITVLESPASTNYAAIWRVTYSIAQQVRQSTQQL